MPQSMHVNLQRLVLLLLLVSFAGCGRIAFVSERYDNFTAYYNTFYNAEKSFTEGVDALEQTEQPVDRRVYISIFEAPGQNTSSQNFQAAIDKSADVLREHPDSKWVDDALLLIGKSYFYQQNYVGAEQKFHEVMDLVSPLEDEARLWLARTLISAGAHDDAREHLLVSLNREELSDRWEPSLRLALGELHVKRSDFDAAVEELTAGLENVRDNRYRARASFLLGQVYETLGRYEDAVEAHQRVADAHPRYELSYAALFSAVRVQGLQVDAEEALRELRRMERDDKNYTNRYELAFLRGRIYQSQNYANDARTLYHEILYDSDTPITDVRGRIHYALGELYRDSYQDYEMASAHFDTARTALQPTTASAGGRRSFEIAYASEAITDAEELSATFGSFADVRVQLAEMDSLLHLGSLDDEEFVARIREIRLKLAEEMAEEERRAARLQAERGFRDAASGTGSRGDAASNAATAASSTDGFLYHLNPVRVQEGRMSFLDQWGDRPLAPNWRRAEAIRGVASPTDSEGNPAARELADLDPSVGEEPLPPLDYSNVPRDSLSRAAMRARRAAARYELANVLFLSMDRPDSAATWYRTVIEEDADFPVAQRAFYALAEVHSSLGDSTAARRLYQQVLEDYPSSDFAGRVRERLGLREEVASDTLAMAEEAYGQAYARWRRESYPQALNHMVRVAAAYPGLEVAPRALLAAGHIYVEWARRDSMDLFGPLPLTLPDSTLESAGLLGLEEASPPPTVSPPLDEATGQTPPADDIPADDVPGDVPGGDVPAGTPVPDAPPTDRAGAVQSADGEIQPFIKGPPTDVLLNDESEAIRDNVPPPVDAIPRGGVRPADSTLAPERDALMPTQEQLDDTGVPAPPDTLEQDDLTQLPRSDSNQETVDDSPLKVVSAAPGAARDTLRVVSDTTIAVSDTSTAITVDPSASALAGDSTAFAITDSSAGSLLATIEEENDVYLKTLYVGVKRHYPGTAYATQADLLLKALEQRESELNAIADSIAAADAARADSLALLSGGAVATLDSLAMGADSLAWDDSTAIADRLAADSTAAAAVAADSSAAAEGISEPPAPVAADSSANAEGISEPPAPVAADSSAAAEYIPETPEGEQIAVDEPDRVIAQREDAAIAENPAADNAPADPAAGATEPAIPTGEDAIRGDGGIQEELGGYTLIIGMDTKEATMRALARKYADLGFRTDVITEHGADETVYRAAIGHFASQRDAGVLLQKYLNQIQESVQLAPLQDFE